jgi:cysteine desulfurase
MSSSPIYLDHHATTAVDPRVLDAMIPYFTERFGNASSPVHAQGREARNAVEAARARVADLIDAAPDELVFTSGATESDNLALLGTAIALESKGKHLVSVCTEHRAVLEPLEALEQRGWQLTLLPVEPDGRVAPQRVAEALTDETTLVSVMLANNEIGVVQDLAAIGALAAERGVVLHCDAAQGVGYLPFSVSELPVDLVSLSAHKMYGPKGVGALYVRRSRQRQGVPAPLFYGGGHQQGLRPGTLDVAGIVGFGAAAALMKAEGGEEAARLRVLRDRFAGRLLDGLDEVRVNGSMAARHPGNLNLSFGYVDGAALLLRVCETAAVSSGAACSSAEPAPSHVLRGLGVPPDWAAASIRFGLGRETTEAELARVADAVIEAVTRLRAASPLYAARREGREFDW